MVYIETVDGLSDVRPVGRAGLSDAAFRPLSEFIDREMENDISCEGLARALDLPLRVLFDGIKARTGLSAYQFVLHRRIARAEQLLTHVRPRDQRDRARLRLRLAAALDRDAVEEAGQYAKAAKVQLSTGLRGQFAFLPRKSATFAKLAQGAKSKLSPALRSTCAAST